MAKTKSKKYKPGDPIEPLPQEKNKNGYRYNLVERSDKAAIYSQVNIKFPHADDDQKNPQKIIGYEVCKILIANPVTLVDKRTGRSYDYPAKEKFPGDENFGKTAWAFCTLAGAEQKFKEINEGTDEETSDE